MDHWEGALMSAHAGKIKASVGLGDSVYDRNKWTQFLTLSKTFHDGLDINPCVSWVEMRPREKKEIRDNLAGLCSSEGLFRGHEHNVEPALEWRMYHLQKTKSQSQKHKGENSGGNQSFSPPGPGPAETPAGTKGGANRRAGISKPAAVRNGGRMPYDPIRDHD